MLQLRATTSAHTYYYHTLIITTTTFSVYVDSNKLTVFSNHSAHLKMIKQHRLLCDMLTLLMMMTINSVVVVDPLSRPLLCQAQVPCRYHSLARHTSEFGY